MSKENLEKLKNNNKKIRNIKVKMIIWKYFEIATLVSGGLNLVESIIKNSAYGFFNSIIVTAVSSVSYVLMAYATHYLHNKNKVKKEMLEKENEELYNLDDYSKTNEKEKTKTDKIKKEKQEEFVKTEETIKEEKTTIFDQRKNLEDLKAQIMNLEIEQSYEEDKKYVKAK